MAEAKHYKLTRRELREPDEFQAVTTQAVDWVREHQSTVVTALCAAVAVAAVVLGIGWYGQRQNDAAAVRAQGAHALFEAGKFSEAAAEFAAVGAEYPRTPSGRIAGLYRAHALAQQPDAAAAATAYSEYLASSPPTDYLRQEALMGLAQAKEASNDAPSATDGYTQAAAIEGPFTTLAKLALARLAEASGDGAKAQALYVEILKAPDVDPDTRRTIASRVPAAAAAAAPAAPDVAPE